MNGGRSLKGLLSSSNPREGGGKSVPLAAKTLANHPDLGERFSPPHFHSGQHHPALPLKKSYLQRTIPEDREEEDPLFFLLSLIPPHPFPLSLGIEFPRSFLYRESQQRVSFDPDSCLRIAEKVGLDAASRGSSLVFSPLSMQAARSMAAVGSRGETLDQMLSFLGSPTLADLNAAAGRLVGSVRTSGAPSTKDSRCGTAAAPHPSFVNGVWID